MKLFMVIMKSMIRQMKGLPLRLSFSYRTPINGLGAIQDNKVSKVSDNSENA